VLWSLLITLASAPEPSAVPLAVAPLRGKGGPECAVRLGEAFGDRVKLVKLDASVEGLTNWDELAEWIEKNGAPEAEVVIVGSLNNNSIVLEAYTTHDKKLIGLKSIDTAGRCKLSEESTQLLNGWISSILPAPPQPRPAEKTQLPVEQKTEGEVAPEETDRSFAIAIRGSVAIGRRGLTFTGATTSNLRAYEVDVMPVPALELEAFPLAGTDIWEYLRPLGLSASFARSIGLSSARIEGGPKLDTIHTEVSASLLYRWQVPLESLRFTLIPEIGWHHLAFGVRSSAGGTEPDLPDVAYSAGSFGIGADVPVLKNVNIFGSASYLAVFAGGQIFSSGFFEDGSARGYRVEIGMGYEAVDGFIIEVAGHHLAYSLKLNPKPTSERAAQTGNDALSGIGLGIRVEL
jgi:hypothetical protein